MIDLKTALDSRPDLQQFLFCRGFLITDQKLETEKWPFYSMWKEIVIGRFFLYHHVKKPVAVYQSETSTYFLIGHAYDPFSGITDEEELLQRFSSAQNNWEETNHWTGVFCAGFVSGNIIQFVSDAAGQQLVYYGVVNGKTYITSHSQIVGELENLRQDPYIIRLKNYRFFHAFGIMLPGDLSPFQELKRVQCNFFTSIENGIIRFQRFWPTKPITHHENAIKEISEIIHGNMACIAEKWPENHVAISVTGGMDTKTTMACSIGLYDRFSYFSYDSLPDEKIDADAAHVLCSELGLKHTIYTIPKDNNEIPDYEIWNEILNYNCGCLGYVHSNDVRKRAYFSANHDFSVEVKSWVDEIGRARYHKRYDKKTFPSFPTGRYLSSFYKPFLFERNLLHQTDKIFDEYLRKYYSGDVFTLIPWWDLIYWEYSWNAGEGSFLTGEHLLSYDITIPYNNRALLELMLGFTLQERIDDEIQKGVIRLMNPKIEQTGINVQDVSHTKNRARMERLYLEINTRLPF